MGCLVSIFTVRLESTQNYSTGLHVPYKKVPTQIFGNVRCPILRIKINTLQCCRATNMEKKQTELETKNK